ncbi:MAG: sporulation rane protein YtaF [Herbinix sp.]|jgi:putative sporulation protein YtaF|nr:sporulation rane protein YtaF [Herbinix sp.]
MSYVIVKIIESVIFVTALSTDALIASFAYGSNKIKIPMISVQVISFLCTVVLGVSLLLGTFLKAYIPGSVLHLVSFGILFILGVIKLLDNLIKSAIDKHTTINKQIEFSLLNLKFILNIYANPYEADVDHSKILSPREALSLALALSIDSLVAGVGAALANVSILAVILSSFILSTLAVKSGEMLGHKLSDKVPFGLSWLSGAILISLAFIRLLK